MLVSRRPRAEPPGQEAEWDLGSPVGRGGGAAPTAPPALGLTAGLVGKRPVS